MTTLFDGDNDVSDEECSFKTNNIYAQNYNSWRQKEEYNKLKTKYGEHSLDLDVEPFDSDSSSDDTDVEISEKVELDFFNTLSSLKTRNPKIYDTSVKFFDDTPIDIKYKKKVKDENMFLKDYERKLLLEKGGVVSDSENEDTENHRSLSPTYMEEQQTLKRNLQQIAENIEDDNENEWGGMFKVRSKSKAEKDLEESEYKQWLMGEKQHLKNSDTEKNLEPLKQYWNDPKLDKGEQFLRDYILNNRFLDKTNPDHVPTYDEIVHDSDEGLSEDEANLTKQEEFEYKYNYRFEEPDQEFIKRYPRTLEHSLRRTDDRRKLKRAEVKERKLVEKEEKFVEIRKMKELKRKEIQERIEKLKEVTGNTKVAFEDIDLEEDFNPEAHDKRMQKLFDDEFYEGEEGNQKPQFPELDEELEIERWDKWEGNKGDIEENVHCEDDDFNMDCDFDPNASSSQQKSTQEELLENSTGGRKKRKRKSKFAKAVSQPKPAFDPNDKSYEDYFDEYYKLDCEDVIGDIPCRFKYRTVVPNSFGLTIDEILNAKDRELNKWCSIKKTVQFRPDHIEKYDVIAYSNKGSNEALKKKILPSLFENEEDEGENKANTRVRNDAAEGKPLEKHIKGKKSKKSVKLLQENALNNKGRKRKLSEEKGIDNYEDNIDASVNIDDNKTEGLENGANKNKKSKNSKVTTQEHIDEAKEAVPSKSKDIQQKETSTSESNSENKIKKKKKIKKQNKTKDNLNKMSKNSKKSLHKKKVNAPKASNKNTNKKSGPELGISDARLKAFGIKPKKFKNKMKFAAN